MNVVEIDTSERPTRFHFSTRFNAAVPFIDRHLTNGLAPYKYPRRVNFVPDLPKTATGKIQRFVLRQPAYRAAGASHGQ
jgi:acyl-coenzyme A synthetase/AMP-(fatty) acid ligase